jgi:hypothetical protein
LGSILKYYRVEYKCYPFEPMKLFEIILALILVIIISNKYLKYISGEAKSLN